MKAGRTAEAFIPPVGLRNRHVQSLIASSALRRMLVVPPVARSAGSGSGLDSGCWR